MVPTQISAGPYLDIHTYTYTYIHKYGQLTHAYTCIYLQIHAYIHICTYIKISLYHHHHPVALSAQIFLTLFRHTSLLSIASGRSSRLHPVLSQSCCMSVRAGRPSFARPCEEVLRSTSLMRSSLLLQRRPSCFVLIWRVFVMGDTIYQPLRSGRIWHTVNF